MLVNRVDVIQKGSFCDDSKMVNVSSTNLFQKYGGCGAVLMAFS